MKYALRLFAHQCTLFKSIKFPIDDVIELIASLDMLSPFAAVASVGSPMTRCLLSRLRSSQITTDLPARKSIQDQLVNSFGISVTAISIEN
jgi:hypothetical protein